jgi:hypothetical protein
VGLCRSYHPNSLGSAENRRTSRRQITTKAQRPWIMVLVLTILACGILGYSLVNEEPTYHFKRILFLDKENKTIERLSSPRVIYTFLGWWGILLLPVVLLAVLHRFAYNVLQCQYCTSFHIGFCSSLALGYSWPMALVIALNAMLACGLYNLIRKYAA